MVSPVRTTGRYSGVMQTDDSPDMGRKYLAFDIETAADVPGPDFNWRAHRPLGISCAATYPCDAWAPSIWHGQKVDGSPTARMSREDARQLVHYLHEMIAKGYTLVTWNGLGFDLDVLSEESGAIQECKDLALDHVDMMFHVVCHSGFPVALDKAAHGMGIPGKPAGMTGVLAPQLWAQGRFQEVMNYVAQDVRIALALAQQCDKDRSLRWTTRRGTTGTMPLACGWLTVREALQLPEPDTSWMTAPLSRQEFMEWLSRR